MKKVYHAHSKHNETGEAILISSKIDFKTKSMIRAKDDIMIKKRLFTRKTYNYKCIVYV